MERLPERHPRRASHVPARGEVGEDAVVTEPVVGEDAVLGVQAARALRLGDPDVAEDCGVHAVASVGVVRQVCYRNRPDGPPPGRQTAGNPRGWDQMAPIMSARRGSASMGGNAWADRCRAPGLLLHPPEAPAGPFHKTVDCGPSALAAAEGHINRPEVIVRYTRQIPQTLGYAPGELVIREVQPAQAGEVAQLLGYLSGQIVIVEPQIL